MSEEIRIGFEGMVQDREAGYWTIEHICSCGFVSEAEYPNRREALDAEKYSCGKCGNMNFLHSGKAPDNKRVALPTFFDNKSDHKGLDFKKTNLSLVFDKKNKKIDVIQPNVVRRYIFNWVDRELKVYRNEKLEYDIDWDREHPEKEGAFRRASTYLSRGFKREEIIENLDLDNEDFYHFLIEEVGNKAWGGGRESLLSVLVKGIRRHEKYNWAQILANAGYKGIKNISTNINYRLDRDLSDNRRNILRDETKPHKILRVSKKISKYMRESGEISSTGHRNLVALCQDTQKLQTINSLIDFIEDKTVFYDVVNIIDDLNHMIRAHSYNGKVLLEYLFDSVKMYQGITSPSNAIRYLKDYADMSRDMDIPFEKYPNSLIREHDVTSLNHREFMSTKETEEFSETMKDNDYLVEKGSEFSVLLPETSKDLVYEGGRLNHCVGSYVSQVSRGDTIIAFLRRTEALYEPLVTIEVKGHQVRQARGSHNRSLYKEEKEFIKEWAEERQLVF